MKLTKDQKKEKYRKRATLPGRRMLEWHFHEEETTCYRTEWRASSQIHDEGSHFKWIINVTEAGRFTIANSDGELINPKKYQQGYTSLQAAQNVCQSLEDGLVVSLTKHPE